ncbi:hypothetical protein SB2_25565 [Methylobacterium radiotolerans]|nr:hypothetical protein SB3_28290 [Methylobacterium radiotolerans]KTS44104.1 hypothetical protein SB2_25565 [Methylobacterium radiotolerans]
MNSLLPLALAGAIANTAGEAEPASAREKVREILGRLYCLAEGENPDELISDAGHTVLCGTLGGLDPKALAWIEAATDAVMEALR